MTASHTKVYVLLAVILVFSLLPRLATLRKVQLPNGQIVYHHLEVDEVVYQTLVDQVRKNVFAYTLRGTPLLGQLNKQNYDHPMFVHPPAFVYVSALLVTLGVPLPLVPVGMNLLTIALVFWIARQVYDDHRALWAAFLVAVCPVLWFVSQKVWLDNMLILTISLSVAVHLWAAGRSRASAYAISGMAFSLAFLTKLTAVFILPALVFITWQKDRREFVWAKVIAFLIPALVFCGAWELTSKIVNDQWVTSGYPNADLLKESSFVAMAVARPWYFYLSTLLLISPVYALAVRKVSLRIFKSDDAALTVWVLVFLAAMTGIGLMKGSYQTRYLAPAYPAMALLAADEISRLKPLGMILVAALVGYGMMNALLYALLGTPDMTDFQESVIGIVIGTLTHVAGLA